MIYICFEDYVTDYPEAERFRNWLGNSDMFIRGQAQHGGLPGGYLWVKAFYQKVGRWYPEGRNNWVTVGDNDDWSVVKYVADSAEAEQVFYSLMAARYLSRPVLESLGFIY